MTHRVHLRPSGLFTDPNPYTEVPDGALLECSNIRIPRAGTIEPRPGFERIEDDDILTETRHIQRMVEWNGDVYGMLSEKFGFPSTLRNLSESDDVTVLGAGDDPSPPYSGRVFEFAEARGNLYMTFNNGVQKLDEYTPGTSATSFAGLPKANHPSAAVSNAFGATWLGNTESVGYRICLVRTDANGYVVRSAPSGNVTVRNSSGGTRGVIVTYPTLGFVEADDVVEVYRTLSAAGDPDGRYFLAGTVTATSPVPASITFNDGTDPDDLGAELYTNASQEGILQENNQPPISRDMEMFRESMFYSGDTDVIGSITKLVRTDIYGGGRFLEPSSADWNVDFDFTTGAPTLTVTGTPTPTDWYNCIYPGMHVVEDTQAPGTAGTFFDADTVVVSVNSGAGTVTISKNPLSNGTAEQVGFSPFLTVTHGISPTTSTRCFFVDDAVVSSNPPALDDDDVYVSVDYDPSLNQREVMESMARALNLSKARNVAIFFAETESLTEARFGIAPHRNAESTSFGSVTWTGGPTAWDTVPSIEILDASDRIYWSKASLPEAVPFTNFAVVGELGKPIRAIRATRDALFILKQDGVFRLTGSGTATGWRIDPFSPDTELLWPEGVANLFDQVFAWTNKGIVAISDAGIAPISEPLVGIDFRLKENAILSVGGPDSTNQMVRACFLSASPFSNELFVGFSHQGANAANEQHYTDKIYVFNTKTTAWSSWDIEATHLIALSSRQLVYSEPDVLARNAERLLNSDSWPFVDRSYSVTVTSFNTTTKAVTISSGSGWTPKVGDVITNSSNPEKSFAVTAVTSATIFTVDSATNAVTGSYQAFDGFEASFRFVVKPGGSPSLVKLWSEGGLALGNSVRTNNTGIPVPSTMILDVSFYLPDEETDLTTSQIVIDQSEFSKPFTARFFVPREVARAGELFPKFRVRWPLGWWQCFGLTLDYNEFGTKGRRTNDT